MRCRRAASAATEGLKAWKRIEAVVTHPRCANCHVDAKAIPIWTPAGEGQTARAWHEHPWWREPHRAPRRSLLDLSHDLHSCRTIPHQRRCAPASTGSLLRWNSSGSARVAPRFVRS